MIKLALLNDSSRERSKEAVVAAMEWEILPHPKTFSITFSSVMTCLTVEGNSVSSNADLVRNIEETREVNKILHNYSNSSALYYSLWL
jgi:hypothetical protein